MLPSWWRTSTRSTAVSMPRASSRAKNVEFNKVGKQIARFLFVEDPDGYKIEVLQKFGRYR